jgi:hypothetical protein
VKESEFDRMRDEFTVRPGEDLSNYEQPHWIVRVIVYLWLVLIVGQIVWQLYLVWLITNHD